MATIRLTAGKVTVELSNGSGFDEASRVVWAIVKAVDALDAMGISSYGQDLRETLIAALGHPAPPRVEHADPELATQPSVVKTRPYHKRRPVPPIKPFEPQVA